MALEAVLAVSLILNIFLLYELISIKRGIRHIAGILHDICSSGSVRRIHAGYKNKSLEDIGTGLNVILDRFQNIIEGKEKLEISHKRLIAGISHDIRTPLTSLLGFVEMLRTDGNISREEKESYLDIIHSKGQSLYKLIEELFELSRLETDDTAVRLVKVDLSDKLRETVASFYGDFLSCGITPDIGIPEGHAYVCGDETGIERILINLISNTLKYGSDCGKIGIALRDGDERVWVDIWDNGAGIPEKEIPFIFNRPYAAAHQGSGRRRGSGLGLIIAKQLVEKQNGEITVSSRPFEKTIFSFSLNKYWFSI